jgi:hypothetical protein
MIQDRLDINLIVKYTGLTLDIIKKMMKEENNE